MSDPAVVECPNCPICLGDVENPVRYCTECDESFCHECLQSYLDSTISSSHDGACPVLYCPGRFHQERKDKRIIPFSKWQVSVPESMKESYSKLAKSLVSFLCGSCHSLRSLDAGYHETAAADSAEELKKILATSSNIGYDELQKHFQLFSIGCYSVETMYTIITKDIFPHFATVQDTDAWHTFAHLLKIIEDPERRVNLHLRYLRDHPRVFTSCCARLHCFTCKTVDFHEGLTCAEKLTHLDNSIVHCPQCDIALVKGDGCNSVTCLCGRGFAWQEELLYATHCREFVTKYPAPTHNPTEVCAAILCHDPTYYHGHHKSTPQLMILVHAWQHRHPIPVNRALLTWFRRTYAPCPTQAAILFSARQQSLTTPSSTTSYTSSSTSSTTSSSSYRRNRWTRDTAPPGLLPAGMQQAIQLWQSSHVQDWSRHVQANQFSVQSLFLTMFPDPKERPLAAYHMLHTSTHTTSTGTKGWDIPVYDTNMIGSVNEWLRQHPWAYNNAEKQLHTQQRKQFLWLYGHQPIHTVLPYTVGGNTTTYTGTTTTPDGNTTTTDMVDVWYAAEEEEEENSSLIPSFFFAPDDLHQQQQQHENRNRKALTRQRIRMNRMHQQLFQTVLLHLEHLSTTSSSSNTNTENAQEVDGDGKEWLVYCGGSESLAMTWYQTLIVPWMLYMGMELPPPQPQPHTTPSTLKKHQTHQNKHQKHQNHLKKSVETPLSVGKTPLSVVETPETPAEVETPETPVDGRMYTLTWNLFYHAIVWYAHTAPRILAEEERAVATAFREQYTPEQAPRVAALRMVGWEDQDELAVETAKAVKVAEAAKNKEQQMKRHDDEETVVSEKVSEEVSKEVSKEMSEEEEEEKQAKEWLEREEVRLYMKHFAKEMNDWYETHCAADGVCPCIADIVYGCTCIPRHRKHCDDAAFDIFDLFE